MQGRKTAWLSSFERCMRSWEISFSTYGPNNCAATASTKGIFLTLSCATNFNQGEADELVVRRVKTNGAQLIKYNINAKAFSLK
jgi:hypothetical protein